MSKSEEELVNEQSDGDEIPPGQEEVAYQEATPLEGSPA